MLLEELVRVQGLVEEAALHRRRRDSRGAGTEAAKARRTAGKASEMADGGQQQRSAAEEGEVKTNSRHRSG